MSTHKEILDEVQDQLQESANLSWLDDNDIIIGDREVEKHSFPCLIINHERTSEDDEEDINGDDVELTSTISIIGHVKNEDPTMLVTGDGANEKGIIDLLQDTLKALHADRTLNGLAFDMRTPDQITESEQGNPIATLIIELQIRYCQNRLTRT